MGKHIFMASIPIQSIINVVVDYEGSDLFLINFMSAYRILWRKQSTQNNNQSRIGRINDVRRYWAPSSMRSLFQVMLAHEYTYAYDGVDPLSSIFDSLISPNVNTWCMQIFLDDVGARHSFKKQF